MKHDQKLVNVASIPQHSPFRYPGGKTWFVPTFKEWIKNLAFRPACLIEPFAGGGIISLTALFDNLVDKAIMVEIDPSIAAVWHTVSENNFAWLADRILNFDLSSESLKQELLKTDVTIRERAFQTILRNRTAHGGIMSPGAGIIKRGEGGKGIRSRWYPKTLARRINNLSLISEALEFHEADGLKVMSEHLADDTNVFFIDPPYTVGGKKAGKRLYSYNEIDHIHLFNLCKKIKGDFLMTYDDSIEVRTLAKERNLHVRLIPMKTTHHTTKEELVIGKNLSWLDHLPGVYEPRPIYSN